MKTLRILFYAMLFLFCGSSIARAQVLKNLSYSAFGEIHYNDETRNAYTAPTQGEVDYHKAFFQAGYKINPKVEINTRLRVEHLLDKEYDGGDAFFDQAYVSYKHSKKVSVKAGIIPVALNVGKIKPYGSVETAPVEKYLAFTWREAGVQFSGNLNPKWSYKATISTGLDASELKAKSGIFSARNSEFSSSIQNLSTGFQLKYKPINKLVLGTSFLYSGLENSSGFTGSLDGVNYKVVEGSATYLFRFLTARAVGVYSGVTKVEKVNAAVGNGIGSRQYGLLGELGYDLTHFLNNTNTDQYLMAFARVEAYDNHYKTSGIADNTKYQRNDFTLGLVYKPVKAFEFKADYLILRSAGKPSHQMFDVGVAYKF